MMIDDDDGAKICAHAHTGVQKVMGKMILKLGKKFNHFLDFLILYYDKYNFRGIVNRLVWPLEVIKKSSHLELRRIVYRMRRYYSQIHPALQQIPAHSTLELCL